MSEVAVAEFPFVAELPKREKSKIGKIWDHWKEVKAITEEKGMLVPPVVAALLLDVSRQRVHQLVEAGRLERVDFGGQGYITEASLVEWAKAEHVNGRPVKDRSLRECIRDAREELKKPRK